jgi:hypothetical protein
MEKGQSWATPDKLHDYSGFLQISQPFIDWIQASFDAQDAENMRMNWKGFVAESSQGAKFLKVQDAWIAKQPSLKQFINEGGAAAPRAAKPAPAAAEAMPEDDIPF